MSFKDTKEREAIMGPLFATEAKAEIPIFGEHKFTSKDTKSIVHAFVKEALNLTSDSVINLLPPPEYNVGLPLASLMVQPSDDQ